MANNVSTTNKLEDYKQAILAFLVLNPTTTPALLKAELEAKDALYKLERHTQIVDYVGGTPGLHRASGGIVSDTIGITTAGTDYVIGDSFPITGGAGINGGLKVIAVGGSGEITGIELINAGLGYTTPVVDLSGKGDGAGDLALTASAVTGKDQSGLLNDMLLETYP